jgi:hypothetical protein
LLLYELVVDDPAPQRTQRHPYAEMPYTGAAARPLQVRVPPCTHVAPQALLQVLALMRRHDNSILRRAAVQVVERIESVVLAVHFQRRAGRQGR